MALFAAADPAAAVVVVSLIGVVTLTVRTRRFAQRHDTTTLERALFMTEAAEAVTKAGIASQPEPNSIDLTDPLDITVAVDIRDELDIRGTDLPAGSKPDSEN